MFKNIVRFEHVIQGRTYHMLCDNDSPLNEVKDALIQFLSYVNQIEAAAKAQQESSDQTASSSEEPKKE